ncbi:MAG: hypothetical protein H6600_00500 [Flavobacteriales bacterium]|nr:hypothetical protein [Flavobacteriales bacterium]
MNRIFLGWLMLFSVELLGQQQIPIQDSTELAGVIKWGNELVNRKQDTTELLLIKGNYKLLYTSTCPFSDYVSAGGRFQNTSGRTFRDIQNLKETDSSGDNLYFFLDNSNQIYFCAESITKPNTEQTYIINCARFKHDDSLYITLKPFFQGEITPTLRSFLNEIGDQTLFAGVSFENGRYLVLEASTIISWGNQTSWGHTNTYYLEIITEP